jgi:hypothetical protein
MADDVTKKKFQDEYVREAKILEERWTQCSGSYSVVVADGKSKRIQREVTVRFSRSQGCEKLEIEASIQKPNSKKTRDSVVYCKRDDNSLFLLKKMPGQSGYKLVRSFVAKNADDLEDYETDYGRILRAPLGGFMRSLVDMTGNGELELIDANPSKDNPAVIEASFAVNNGTLLKQLNAKFDTTNHWAVVEQAYLVGTPLKQSQKYEVEYGEKVSGVAFPSKFELDSSDETLKFGKWSFEPIPRDAYSLPYYGIADVFPENRKSHIFMSTGAYLSYAVIAMALMGGVVFKITKQRRIGAEL